jgi:hypothetical protein
VLIAFVGVFVNPDQRSTGERVILAPLDQYQRVEFHRTPPREHLCQ